MGNTIYWFIGSIFVILSWFRIVPPWVGWTGFICASLFTTLGTSNWGLFEWSSLWILGLFLVIIGWIGFLHRAFTWLGLFITLTAVGMEWISFNARTMFFEPISIFGSTFDLLFLMILVNLISLNWFFSILINDKDLLAINQRITSLIAMSDMLEKRNDPKQFEKRSDILFYSLLKESIRFFEHIGKYTAISSFFGIIIFLLIALNYYSSDIGFQFFIFSTNWFWAVMIDFVLVGSSIYYILEKVYRIQLFR